MVRRLAKKAMRRPVKAITYVWTKLKDFTVIVRRPRPPKN